MEAKRSSRRDPESCSTRSIKKSLLVSLLAAAIPSAHAQNCIPLRGSAACAAFNESSISTGPETAGLFPFLAFVSDAKTFDARISEYISTTFSQQRYQQLIGCTNVNLSNTTSIYARYTTSVLCNAIVQNSIRTCGLSAAQSRPLCADTCAQNAISEAAIASSPELCGNPGPNALVQIRADFTNCALPADSLAGSCISGVFNEPQDCGYSSNLQGLCAYCAASSPNSTDSCCINSRTEKRCTNVKLPITTAMGPVFPTSSGNPNATAIATPGKESKGGLSGGAIAGIVIGSVLGAAVLLALIIGACILVRKRTSSKQGSIFNQPSPARRGGPAMSYTGSTRNQQPDILPGARVARMAALEGSPNMNDSPIEGAGFLHSSSDFNDSPESQRSGLLVAGLPKRGGSLNDHSSSPHSHQREPYSSPEGLGSGQSEQLQSFKDYYSQDDIRPGEVVATLWAYQPRANDEWGLERGDMLKVVGIWDDGWATGVKIKDKAEDWESKKQANRDSGVSNASSVRPASPVIGPEGEIKAFPLVCVCLPQHWRKAIEGDTAEQTGRSTGSPPMSGEP